MVKKGDLQNLKGDCFIGIDAGSTTTKLVVIDKDSNLLYSLKPYLREEKKGKIDQYANLLNVAKIADLLKDNNKESPHNG